MSVTAMIQTGPRALELAELPTPAIGDLDTLVRVEACGLCGTDVEFYRAPAAFFAGRFVEEYPIIRGHEPVGVVEQIGDGAAARRGLQVGDRVAVDPFIPCGICRSCLNGRSELCTGWGTTPNIYGSIPMAVAPGIWGGYATHLFAGPQSVLHPLPAHIGPELGTLYNALGAGIKWGVDLPGTTIGSTVVILGCGQRGICCAIAARAAGAGLVVVTGLASDRHKLDLALELGADVAVNVEEESIVDKVAELTGGLGVDVVVDASSQATQPVLDAIEIARRGGTIVLGGIKSRDIPDFPVDLLVRKSLTLKGLRGIGSDPYRRAIEIIVSERFDLDRLRTHVFPLEEVEHALAILGGEEPGERAINIVVTP